MRSRPLGSLVAFSFRITVVFKFRSAPPLEGRKFPRFERVIFSIEEGFLG